MTVVFDGFDEKLFEELSLEEQIKNMVPRMGTNLPYSISTDSVNKNVGIRLAYSCFPEIVKLDEKFSFIKTEHEDLKIPNAFVDVIEWLKKRRKTSSEDISKKFGLDLERCIKFVDFGLKNNLFISGLGK